MPTIHHGDCIQVMNAMPPESVDAIVTDPPYGLGFMGRKWDSLPPSLEWAEACMRVLKPGGHIVAFGGTRTWHRLAVAIEDAGFEMRDSLAWLYGSGFPKSLDVSKAIDKRAHVNDETHRRIALVAEVIRTHREAKGMERAAVSLAVVGTPSGACWNWEHHQLPSAEMWPAIKATLDIPDKFDGLIEGTREMFIGAEREVIGTRTTGIGTGRGSVAYIADSNNRDITAPATPEAVQWDGWGTALKPAFEPIVLARKPLAEKTVARNVLAYGTGAINVDACRIGTTVETWPATRSYGGDPSEVAFTKTAGGVQRAQSTGSAPSGRWPANVLLDQHAAAWVDEQSGHRPGGAFPGSSRKSPRFTGATYNGGKPYAGRVEEPPRSMGDSGGASRFFYSAKAPKSERPNVDGVQHPTVKPLAIMRWLIRLVTPPGGTVLDPFAGSGTTIEAALIEGFDPVGIEMETDYLPLIQHRIDRQAGTLTA